MAVIITNMKMPKSCYECRFSEPAYSGNRCDNMIGHKYSEILSERVKNCPLKEVPSGKWIPIGYDGYADGNPVYDVWECSNCGYEHNGDNDTLTAYCPDCGCNMVDLG